MYKVIHTCFSWWLIELWTYDKDNIVLNEKNDADSWFLFFATPFRSPIRSDLGRPGRRFGVVNLNITFPILQLNV